MQRNAFVKISKLSDVVGRCDYISNPERQENLYAVYSTTNEKDFWSELAEYNQLMFQRNGTNGKCIEARELIIALPEKMLEYDPQILLKQMTDHFKERYGVECISALHHNKKKTNYHIHLIFSERKLLEHPEVKVATRARYYDERGNHVRTKKEILDETGQVRKGCKVIAKGEIYEKNIFDQKNPFFKTHQFREDNIRDYASYINTFVPENDRLGVYDKDSVYLPMKKIGKNNPMEEFVRKDNELRMSWNRHADEALSVGVDERDILVVKKEDIAGAIKKSIRENGRKPNIFAQVIQEAIAKLVGMIQQVSQVVDDATKISEIHKVIAGIEELELVFKTLSSEEKLKLSFPARPAIPELLEKRQQMELINMELKPVNKMLYRLRKELDAKKEELDAIKPNLFNKGRRTRLQEEIDVIEMAIRNQQDRVKEIAQAHGYKSVQAFRAEWNRISKIESDYYGAMDAWKEQCIKIMKGAKISIHERLERAKVQVKESDKLERGMVRGKNSVNID